MVENTRESRYIGSSDGLRMQAEATQQVGNSALQGIQKINASTQGYYEGVLKNSQYQAQLAQNLSQIEVARASQPNSLSQLAEGVVKGLEYNRQQTDLKARQQAALAKEAQLTAAAKAKDETLAKFTKPIGDLTDAYRSSNWNNGIEQYKKDASVILSNLPTDVDPDVKRQLIQKVYEATSARSAEMGANVQKEQDNLKLRKTDIERAGLVGRLSSIVGNISSQSIDSQASPFLKQANDIFQDFIKTDNGLPYSNKLGIIADAINGVNTAYADKTKRYLERTSSIQDWQQYSSKYKAVEAQYNAGQITFDDMRNQQNLLNLRYPGMEDKVVKTGDEERQTLANQTLADSLRKNSEDAGARAIQNYRVSDATTQSMIASAYSDPATYNKFKNDPNYKDLPQFKLVTQMADRVNEYIKSDNQAKLAQASAAVAFGKLDFSNLQTYTSVVRSVVNRDATKPLTPAEQLLKQYVDQTAAGNPQLAATLGIIQQSGNKQLSAEQQAQIQQTLSLESDATKKIQQSIIQEAQAKQNAVYTEFQDLQKYGFLGQTPDAIRAFARNHADLVNKEVSNIDRLRTEATQNSLSPQYGIRPNFNQSSSFGTSLDDRGRVRVVPRAAAQLIRLSDGSSVVTPVIAGDSAPVTSAWANNRGSHKHAGVDFGLGTSGRAISMVPGTVVAINSSDSKGYGTFIDILGDNGYIYRYAHQQPLIKLGARVSAGEAVGQPNLSGRNTGAHLHFEVHAKANFNNGDYVPSYGFENTIDPIAHLRSLTAGESNVTALRANTSAYRQQSTSKVNINSTLTSGGGAVNGSTYQNIGGKPGQVQNRLNNQRPLRTTASAPFSVNKGRVTYDYGDSYGYAELAKDSGFRRALVDSAKTLGVPPQWLADIARQEAGSLNPRTDHDGNHYGLFGFGSDSFSDPSIHKKLRQGMGAADQLKLYVKYVKENGWDKLVSTKSGQITVADLWAFSRMGYKMRQKFFKTGDTSVKTEGGLTYADELKLLGKWVGRPYNLPGGRSRRSSAISETSSSYCSICQQLASSGTFAPHAHEQA